MHQNSYLIKKIAFLQPSGPHLEVIGRRKFLLDLSHKEGRCLATPVLFEEDKLLLNLRCYIEMGDCFHAYMAYSFLGISVDDIYC